MHGGPRYDLVGIASLLVPGRAQLLRDRPGRAMLRMTRGAPQATSCVRVLLAPSIVPAAGGETARRIGELLLRAAGAAALMLMPLRLSVARDAARGEARPRGTERRARRTRMQAYPLVIYSLYAAQSLPTTFHRDATQAAGEHARAAGLDLVSDAAEAWCT
jgi:hypothetical protein